MPTEAPSRSRRLVTGALVALLFAGAMAFGYHRAHFGLNYTDEGLYLAAPLRYAFGDLPFRDEFINPQRMFDIVLAPLFFLHRDVTVYELRCLNVTFEVAAALLLFATLRRYCPPLPLALACASTIFIQNLSWLPSYHNLGSTLAMVSWCCWEWATRAARPLMTITLAALAGCAFFLGAMVFVPMLAVLAVPGVLMLVAAYRHGVRHPVAVAGATQIAVVLALCLAFVAVIGAKGLVPDYLYATHAITAPTHYALSTIGKIKYCWKIIWPDLSVLLGAAGAAFWLTAMLGQRRPARYLLPGALLLGAVLVLAVANPSSRQELQDSASIARYLRVALMALGLHLGVLLAPRAGDAPADDAAWRYTYASALLGAGLLATLLGILSVGPFKMMLVVPLLYPLALAAIARRAADNTPGARGDARAAAALALFTLPMLVIVQLLPWHYVFKEQQIAHQTTPFTTERLRDIYTLPADAASIGKLTDYFRDRVRPGDFLLAYNNLPVVYYVTRTRPALDQCWTETTAMPLWVTENSLEYMLQYRRVPRYCVRLARAGTTYSTDAREDPLNTLVERHYTRVATIPYTEFEPFCDIFELRADSPLAQYRPEGADTP